MTQPAEPGVLQRLSTSISRLGRKSSSSATVLPCTSVTTDWGGLCDGCTNKPPAWPLNSTCARSTDRRPAQAAVPALTPPPNPIHRQVIEEIPPNFLKACKGSVEKAGRKWLASKQWREENDIGACVRALMCCWDHMWEEGRQGSVDVCVYMGGQRACNASMNQPPRRPN